jgi:AraC-like DNA-binding protein
MSFNTLNIILFLAAAQGLLLTVLIFQKHRRLFANRFLASIMFFYSIIIIQLLLTDLEFDRKYPHLMLIPIGLPLLMGPLHYLYAKSLIHSWTKIKKKDWLHALPFIIYELSLIPDYFTPRQELAAAMQKIYIEGLPFKYVIFNWFILIQIMTYMIFTILIIKNYSRTIKNVFSTIEKIKLDWLRNITYMGIFVVTIFLIENILLLVGINLSHFFNLTSLLFAIFIYIMGYMGLLKSEIFAEPEIAKSISELPKLNYQTKKEREKNHIKYKKSGLSPERAKEYLETLLRLMEKEKPYTDSNLTLTQLAGLLSITPHNLSEILNTQLNQNFFDFINQYRLEEAKKGLADPGKQHFTVLAIGFDSGFNSKTAFNTIFKKFTNMTPSEYRAQFGR